jgi:hypothetical protein
LCHGRCGHKLKAPLGTASKRKVSRAWLLLGTAFAPCSPLPTRGPLRIDLVADCVLTWFSTYSASSLLAPRYVIERPATPAAPSLTVTQQRVKGIDFHPTEPWILSAFACLSEPRPTSDLTTVNSDPLQRPCLHLVIRDPAGCQDVRAHRCPGPCRPLHCAQELDCLRVG